MNPDKFHMVHVGQDFGSGGMDTHSSIGFRKQRYLSLTMKTKLFDYLPDKIKQIAYVDCDVIFAIPGCAADLMHANDDHWETHPLAVTRLYHANVTYEEGVATFTTPGAVERHPELNSFIPAGNNRITNLHLGSFLAHRQHSRDMMSAWEHQLGKFTEVCVWVC